LSAYLRVCAINEKYLLLILFAALEFFEAFWQKGDNFREYIQNLFIIYKKNIILFFSLHSTLYYVIFVKMLLNKSGFLINFIILLKLLDLVFKIKLLDKIKKNENLGVFSILLKENFEIPIYMKYFGVLLYPTLLYFALR